MKCCLGKGELTQLTGGRRGLRLRCLKGTIWVTTGDGVDYLVQQGNSFDLKAGATALAEALDTAEMRLEAPSHEGTIIAQVAVHP
ncbi:MAG TPA: hypothetical protein DCZ75_01600 [Geobacter sp.]|nr:hypothetical protein [Geobacter sp.]